MGNGNNDKKEKTTTTTTSSPPGSLMSDIIAGLGALGGRKKRMKEAESISPDSGNPCHYGTHMKDKSGMNRQGRSKGGKSCHHGK